MLYKVKFEHHYSNKEDEYHYYEYLMQVASFASISKRLTRLHSEGYIHIMSAEEVRLYDGDFIDITKGYGAVSL